MASMTACPVTTPEPTGELISFVKRQIRDGTHYVGKERRWEDRHLMVVPVLAQPVDEQFNPVGEPFAVVTRDISQHGVGLVHSEPICHPMLALQMSLAGEEVNVAARVVWCESVGPFYYIGGEFVAKLTAFPGSG